MKLKPWVDPFSIEIDQQIRILEEKLEHGSGYLSKLGVEGEVRSLIAKYHLDMSEDFIPNNLIREKAENLSSRLELHCIENGGSCCSYNPPKHFYQRPGEGLVLVVDNSAGENIKENGTDFFEDVLILKTDLYGCVFQDDSGACSVYEDRPLYCIMWPIELVPVFAHGAYDARPYSGNMEVIIGECNCINPKMPKSNVVAIKKEAAALFASNPEYVLQIATLGVKRNHLYINKETKPKVEGV